MNLSPKLILFCKQHENDDVYILALQAHLYPDIDLQFAIRQIKGMQIAKNKLPRWYVYEQILYPPHLSLEQASSEKSGLYKQELCIKGDTMIDLTGGLGVDCSFLSKRFNRAVYVEQQLDLSLLAKHNFGVLGLDNIEVVNEDAVKYLQEMEGGVDLIYIDPARRNTQGNKIFLIEDCTPNLLEIQDILISKAQRVMIKLSPMLDLTLALSKLKNVSSVHIVSVNNEVKELLFIVEQRQIAGSKFYCVNIQKKGLDTFSFDSEEEGAVSITYTSDIKMYLYEPNASIMKAGAYKLAAHRFGLEKLHVNSHLFTSDTLVAEFPGRIFKAKSVFSLSKSDLKKNVSDIKKMNITIRNFPMTVDALRKRLKVSEGGDDYLFATTIANGQKVLVLCEKL